MKLRIHVVSHQEVARFLHAPFRAVNQEIRILSSTDLQSPDFPPVYPFFSFFFAEHFVIHRDYSNSLPWTILDLISFYNDGLVVSWCFFYYYELYNERFLRMCRNFLCCGTIRFLQVSSISQFLFQFCLFRFFHRFPNCDKKLNSSACEFISQIDKRV